MSTVDVLIPARNERFLPETIKDVLANAAGRVEVYVVLEGYHPDPPLPEHPQVHLIYNKKPKGLRGAVNAAAAAGTGEYLMKLDAHCAMSPAYDAVLSGSCADNWIIIPPRYSLDPINWCIEKSHKPRRDYHYLSSPIGGWLNRHDYTMHGVEWWARCKERLGKPEYDLDETMSGQGSCWFMTRKHWERLGGYHGEEGYGLFINELQEIGNKTWGMGGALMTNKKCWYAHLHKGKIYGRMYHLDNKESHRGQRYCALFWMEERWQSPDKVRSFEWLIDHFWPVPDWPENWKELHAQGLRPDPIA